MHLQHARRWPPKGSYPHPDGGYVLPDKNKNGIRISTHIKAEPDTKALAMAIIELAQQINTMSRQ